MSRGCDVLHACRCRIHHNNLSSSSCSITGDQLGSRHSDYSRSHLSVITDKASSPQSQSTLDMCRRYRSWYFRFPPAIPHLLPCPPVSFAGITVDGSVRLSCTLEPARAQAAESVGRGPTRLQPCVWVRQGKVSTSLSVPCTHARSVASTCHHVRLPIFARQLPGIAFKKT